MSSKILLVEDEQGVVIVVSDLLQSEGHTVETARDGVTGLQRIRDGGFDLLILDVGLPGLNGLEVCNAAREQGFDGAVLMLTARGEVHDKVKGLRTGADDYLVKPFDPEELVARVDALLRRVHKAELTPVSSISFGSVTADFATMRFTKSGRTLSLTGKEAELLRYLVNQRGQTMSRESILQHVWRESPHITPRTVDVHVAWLRQKIEDDPQSPRHIITLRGEGYRFQR